MEVGISTSGRPQKLKLYSYMKSGAQRSFITRRAMACKLSFWYCMSLFLAVYWSNHTLWCTGEKVQEQEQYEKLSVSVSFSHIAPTTQRRPQRVQREFMDTCYVGARRAHHRIPPKVEVCDLLASIE